MGSITGSSFWRTSLLLLAALFLFQCSSRKGLPYEKPKSHNMNYLKDKLVENNFDFNTLKSRVGVKAYLQGEKNSVKVTLRIENDSAIWASISYATVPVARALISRDTVKFLVKQPKKEYFIGDFQYLNRLFGTELTYDFMQAMVVGDAIGFDEKEKYKNSIDSAFYLIQSHSKRKMKKIFEKGKEKKRVDYVFRYWLDGKTFQMNRQIINNRSDSTTIEVQYSNYEMLNEQLFPMTQRIIVTGPSDTAKFDLKFSKMKTDINLTMPFKITDKYIKIE